MSKICIVCKKAGYYSTNHISSKLLFALKKSKAIRQFVAEIVNGEGDEEEAEIVEHLVDIATHVVNSDVPSDQVSSESPYTFMKTTLSSDPDNISTFAAELRESTTCHAFTGRFNNASRYSSNLFVWRND